MEKDNKLTDRQDLKDKLGKAVAELKTQCKDARFFDTLIDRILSLKGQIDTEAVRVLVKESDVVKEYKGDTFYVAVTKKAAIYHTYGGYTVIADNRNGQSLYFVLEEICDTMLAGDADEMVYADVMAKMHVLSAPTWCFTDADATYGIAAAVLNQLNDLSERLQKEPLQEEDTEANTDFEEAVRGAEHINQTLKEEKADEETHQEEE